MLIPMRCYTCGNVTSAATLQFMEARTEAAQKHALDQAGSRTCCRRMLLGMVHAEPLALSYVNVSAHMSSQAQEVPRPDCNSNAVCFGR